jgi:beta-lactamase superfamily II metal-dependent hydrolase
LNALQPETVIIGIELNNQYGHTHQEALQRFSEINANVYGTFESGAVILRTDGNTALAPQQR